MSPGWSFRGLDLAEDPRHRRRASGSASNTSAKSATSRADGLPGRSRHSRRPCRARSRSIIAGNAANEPTSEA